MGIQLNHLVLKDQVIINTIFYMLDPWWLKSIDAIFLQFKIIKREELLLVRLFVCNNQLMYWYLEMDIVLLLQHPYILQCFLWYFPKILYFRSFVLMNLF